MNELNEKLAELCGMERCGFYWKLNNQLAYKAEELEFASCAQLDDWNPTTNLNQLKMCYEALSEDELIRFAELTIYAPFDAWVTQTELVAQAILKAKGVS